MKKLEEGANWGIWEKIQKSTFWWCSHNFDRFKIWNCMVDLRANSIHRVAKMNELFCHKLHLRSASAKTFYKISHLTCLRFSFNISSWCWKSIPNVFFFVHLRAFQTYTKHWRTTKHRANFIDCKFMLLILMIREVYKTDRTKTPLITSHPNQIQMQF